MEKFVLYAALAVVFIIAIAIAFNFVSPWLAWIMVFAVIYSVVKAGKSWINRN